MSGARHLPNAHHAGELKVKQETGFSLLEVMVAILVLGIALAALTRGITTALRSNKESELQTIAALFAAGQIETLRAEGDFIDGEEEGECGEGLPLYRWKQTVSPTDIDGLHEVDVAIEHSGSGQAVYELQTMLFEPAEEATAKADAAKPGKGQKR
jgi:general secretion pathway protein I